MALPTQAGFAISVVAQNTNHEARVFTYAEQCAAYGVMGSTVPQTQDEATAAAQWLAQVAGLEGYPDMVALSVSRQAPV